MCVLTFPIHINAYEHKAFHKMISFIPQRYHRDCESVLFLIQIKYNKIHKKNSGENKISNKSWWYLVVWSEKSYIHSCPSLIAGARERTPFHQIAFVKSLSGGLRGAGTKCGNFLYKTRNWFPFEIMLKLPDLKEHFKKYYWI